jgi:hypothetical protein
MRANTTDFCDEEPVIVLVVVVVVVVDGEIDFGACTVDLC